MYYELYIDVFFLENFMMDAVLLLLMRKLLQCSATHVHICLGALSGSVLACLAFLFPVPYAVVRFILFHAVINVVMIRIGLQIKWKHIFPRPFFMLYVSGFLVGGIFQYLRQYLRAASLFFALAAASYGAAYGAFWILGRVFRIGDYRCEVILCQGERTCRVRAMIDTGNGLRDVLTGKAVSIVSAGAVQTLLGDALPEKIRYIPYCSIGKKNGVLLAVTLDRMCICKRQQRWIEQPLIGIYEGDLSGGESYEMILNPDV